MCVSQTASRWLFSIAGNFVTRANVFSTGVHIHDIRFLFFVVAVFLCVLLSSCRCHLKKARRSYGLTKFRLDRCAFLLMHNRMKFEYFREIACFNVDFFLPNISLICSFIHFVLRIFFIWRFGIYNLVNFIKFSWFHEENSNSWFIFCWFCLFVYFFLFHWIHSYCFHNFWMTLRTKNLIR